MDDETLTVEPGQAMVLEAPALSDTHRIDRGDGSWVRKAI
jgi:hypothetical protein